MHLHELGLALPDRVELGLQPPSRKDERRGGTATLNAPGREQQKARKVGRVDIKRATSVALHM